MGTDSNHLVGLGSVMSSLMQRGFGAELWRRVLVHFEFEELSWCAAVPKFNHVGCVACCQLRQPAMLNYAGEAPEASEAPDGYRASLLR